jgi:hypothetical protein
MKKHFYHYTTKRNKKSIKKNKQIWFSCLSEFKKRKGGDHEELIHGLKAISEIINSRLEQSYPNIGPIRYDSFYEAAIKDSDGFYAILSLCRRKNNKYLLKKYAKDNKSPVSVPINLLGKEISRYTIKVKYVDTYKEVSSLFSKEIESLLKNYVELKCTPQEEYDNDKVIEKFNKPMMNLALSIKRTKYKLEEEIRFFILRPIKDKKFNKDYNYLKVLFKKKLE